MPTVPVQPEALRILADAFDSAATTQPTKQAAARLIVLALLSNGFTIIKSDTLADVREAAIAACKQDIEIRNFVAIKQRSTERRFP